MESEESENFQLENKISTILYLFSPHISAY